VEKIISTVTKHHKIDILVNVASIQRRCPAPEYPQETWDEVINVNLNSVFVLCRDMGKSWIENKIQGTIVNTASLATFQGGINIAAYTASKGAVGQLTKALSSEWFAAWDTSECYRAWVSPKPPSPHFQSYLRSRRLIDPLGYIATHMNIDTRSNADKTYY
jgi:2-deoxy-D-gluconate 3-dehydrogenase